MCSPRSLSLSRLLSLSLPLSLSFPLSLSLSHTHTHTRHVIAHSSPSFFLSLLSNAHIHTSRLTKSSLRLTPFISLSHTHTHALVISLSLFFSPSLSLSLIHTCDMTHSYLDMTHLISLIRVAVCCSPSVAVYCSQILCFGESCHTNKVSNETHLTSLIDIFT